MITEVIHEVLGKYTGSPVHHTGTCMCERVQQSQQGGFLCLFLSVSARLCHCERAEEKDVWNTRTLLPCQYCDPLVRHLIPGKTSSYTHIHPHIDGVYIVTIIVCTLVRRHSHFVVVCHSFNAHS